MLCTIYIYFFHSIFLSISIYELTFFWFTEVIKISATKSQVPWLSYLEWFVHHHQHFLSHDSVLFSLHSIKDSVIHKNVLKWKKKSTAFIF